MDEQQTPEVGRPRTGRILTSVGVVIAAAALVAAGFVVIRSFRNVKPEPLPSSLRTAPPDTGFVAFRAGMRRKALNLSARCESKRKQLGRGMTPSLDSLSRGCDSSIRLVIDRIAELGTATRENRGTVADSVRAEYERAKLKVRVFTRTGLGSDTIPEDSLDREVKKLIGE